MNKADWLVFVSQAMMAHFSGKHGFARHRCSVIPCATDTPSGLDERSRHEMRETLGIQDRLVFVYVGSMRRYQLIPETIQMFCDIRKRIQETYLLVLTHFEHEIRRIVESRGVPADAYSITSVDHHEVAGLLQAADIGFLLREDTVLNRVSSPTKFGEYCMCGVPVITTSNVGDFSEAVVKHGIGYVMQELTVDSGLLEFVKRVRRQRLEYSERCRRFVVRNLSWDVHGMEVERVYDLLASGND